MRNRNRLASAGLCLSAAFLLPIATSTPGLATNKEKSPAPLVIVDQGSKWFGGKVVGDPAVASLSCDHGYVQWQTPQNHQGKLPILMWGSSLTKTWETPTPAGGEGFNNIFLRRGNPVYIIEGVGAGRAGQSCDPYGGYTPNFSRDQNWPNSFRYGVRIAPEQPVFFPRVAFPVHDPKAVDQLKRASYTGEQATVENIQAGSSAVAALLEEIGPTVLFTHSGSGTRGWWTRVKSDKVKAIVSFEPGSFLFPQGEVPPPTLRADGELISAVLASPGGSPGAEVPLADFLKLTKIPILIITGDNIPRQIDPINVGPRLGLDNARLRVVRANLFVDAINRHGGNAVNVILPDRGIYGNGHYVMWDTNNHVTAKLIADFLDKHLKKNGKDSNKHDDDDDDHHHDHH